MEPDPGAASDQKEFRDCLTELMRWTRYGSLQQLDGGATRLGVSMPCPLPIGR